MSLAFRGDADAARAAADAAIEGGADLAGLYEGLAYGALAFAAIAAGDPAMARDAIEAAVQLVQSGMAATYMSLVARAALASGDLEAARHWADEAVAGTAAWPYHAMEALAARTRVAMAHGEPDQAERDAHEALRRGAGVRAYVGVPDVLECLAGLAGDAGSHPEAARLFGAAEAMRERMGTARFQTYDRDYEAAVAALRNAMDHSDFGGRLVGGRRSVRRRGDRLRAARPR